MINDIFWDLIAEDIVVVYLNDIFIFTRTIEEYMRAVWRVLKILVEHKLFLHLEKCKFQKEWIKYLDLVISENKVSIDPIKITRVCEWLIPKNRTNVQAFLGLSTFIDNSYKTSWLWHTLSLTWPEPTKYGPG